MIQPQIIEKPEMTFGGCHASFIHALSPDTTNFKVIPPLWEEFFRRVEDVPGRIGNDMFGVIWGRPESERKHPHELEYLAGVAVKPGSSVPEGMVSRTIPAGTFTVFIHRGPIKNIGTTVHEIYRVWLPQSEYEHSGVADVEVYGSRFCPDGEDSEMEYWISVMTKQSR